VKKNTDYKFPKIPKKHPKKIKVVEKKLGKEKAWGQAWSGENLIEIDPRLKGRDRLGTLCHEVGHLSFEEATEDEILEFEEKITQVLWDQGYRRIDI
jgi:hypothetical protein